MADPGVSGQNFLRLLLGGAQKGVDQIPRQQAQQADLTLALQRMMQQQGQFDASMTQRRDIATAANEDRDAARLLSQGRLTETAAHNRAIEGIGRTNAETNSTRAAIALEKSLGGTAKGGLSQPTSRMLSFDYENYVKDYKATTARNKELAKIIPDFVAEDQGPLQTWEQYLEIRSSQIFEGMSIAPGGDVGGAPSEISDEQLRALAEE